MIRTALILLASAAIASAAAQTLAPADTAFLQSTSSLRSSLVGYWRLEEASGTRYDCSKNGNHLTSNNSVGQGTGVQTYCSTFVTSSSQRLGGGTNMLQLNANTFWTLAFWFKLTTTNTVQVFCSRDNLTTKREFVAWWDVNGRVKFSLSKSINAMTDNTWTSAVDGTAWHFVVCGRTNTDLFLSVDNGTLNTVAIGGTPATSDDPFYIGSDSSGSPLYLNGSMDEVGIWTRILTAAERTQLYHSGLGTHFPWAHP